MTVYPINLNLHGRQCLVLGGGLVAERKVHALLAAGARVMVCSPKLTDGLAGLAAEEKIDHDAAGYRPGAIGNFFIVICATDDSSVNRQAAEEARGQGALLNVVDAPELCDFTVPAQVARGELLLTVSTGGKSPALARRLREELELHYGPEYGLYLELLARLRDAAKERPGTGSAARQAFWRTALDHDILALLKAGKIEEAEEKIKNAASCIGVES
ncbi:MAG: bifunctional precorrin-2 dehydrogenase/sirohydrochlorin ferrochelatase [Negativicutes bacterium]|nr:bifunctional precorrin-2 dehydrogenase/sirohydrochlorin ferrochelatase [Negativicutes bacterium]